MAEQERLINGTHADEGLSPAASSLDTFKIAARLRTQGNLQNGICGHRLFSSFPQCTLFKGHKTKWHHHRKADVPNPATTAKEGLCQWFKQRMIHI